MGSLDQYRAAVLPLGVGKGSPEPRPRGSARRRTGRSCDAAQQGIPRLIQVGRFSARIRWELPSRLHITAGEWRGRSSTHRDVERARATAVAVVADDLAVRSEE